MSDNVKFAVVTAITFAAVAVGGISGIYHIINAGFDFNIQGAIFWLVGLVTFCAVSIWIGYISLPPDDEPRKKA